jgi:gliding motility-associated-like protein
LKNLTPKLLKQLLLLISLLICSTSFAQQITTDTSLSVQDLIENNLASGCVEISNVSTSINGSVNGLNSFGLFNRNGSTFPFESGILLTTGENSQAGNTPNTAIISSGDNNWLTDPDIETALGITNTLNATSIEFDFISGTNTVQFNYVFASEEYFGNNPCTVSDSFVFLIKETASAAPFTNLAVIPSTTTPVNTTNVHDEITGTGGCAAANETFFFGTDPSTNYNGRTTVLTASASITADVSYTIKLIIADSRFTDFDSAVFIEANSFDNTVDLGEDVSTCDSYVTLDATVLANNPTYEWSLNGTNLPALSNIPIVNLTNSGIYIVDVSIPLNGGTCTFSDTIDISLNNFENGPDIEDIQLCDDISNDGFGVFNFAQAEAELLAELPQPETYNISYHFTNNQAQSGNNPILNTTNFPNTVSPQVIHVRAVNSLGCVYITLFRLVVNPYPIIVDPTDPFFICTNDGGADLNSLNDDITGGNPDYTVTYHSNQPDADSGANPLAIPYTPISSPETVFIRVTTSSGCSDSTANVEITVSTNPPINTAVQQIDACTIDPFAAFDITSVEANILLGLTGVTVTYHENNIDAETGDNPIPDPTNYTNIIESEQLVYIRVVDNISGCVSIHQIELHTQLLYTGTDFTITPGNPVEFFQCDNDFDQIVEFSLPDIGGSILNDLLTTTDAIAQFYLNDPVIDPTEPEIDQSIPFLVDSTTDGITLFVTLIKTNPDCVYNNEITLNISEGININPLVPQNYCDTDDDLSAVTVSDFNFFNTYLTTEITPTPLSFIYYPTQQDAEDNTLPFAANHIFINPNFPQSIFFTATNTITNCSAIGELQVLFQPAPSINIPNNIFVCTTDGNSTADINLENTIPQINNGTGLNFTFHTSNADAINSSNAIVTPTVYNTGTRTISARIENTTTGCFAIQEFEVIVNSKPDVMIDDYVVCLPIGSTTGDFFFEQDIDPLILASMLSSPVIISYYQDYNTSTNTLSNPIDKTIVYNNTTLAETVFVLIEYNNDITCSTVVSFNISVGELPDYVTGVTTFSKCDDDSNDGIETFDLTDFSSQLEQGSSQTLNITYYLDEDDANNQVNQIPDITNFTNTVNPQTIYYNVDNGTICEGVAGFELQVTPIPAGTTPMALVLCDTNTNNTDGVMPFDIASVQNEILGAITDREREEIIINYYPSQLDFDNNTNLIFSADLFPIETFPAPYTNITNPQTLIIQILNTSSTCFDTVELLLTVDVPPLINSGQIFQECFNTDNEFNITTPEINTALIGIQTNVTLEFYEFQTDAETQTDVIPNPYNYGTNTSVELWVRANFIGSNCFNVESFNIQINPLPTANTTPNLITCDDNAYDLIEIFDLSVQTPVILGAQNPANFTVTYYETQDDADNATNPITNLTLASPNNEDYFIRIENNSTNCFNTSSFLTIVNRKPFIELNDVPLCLDDLPLMVTAETGISTDNYSWTPGGQNTAEITINTVGTYGVTITTQFGCTFTTSFVVEESEAAVIEFTETVDFSDPNSITVNINTSGIGDYLYQLNNGLPQVSNFFNNVSLGVHIVTVIDQNGCNSVSKEVIVFDIPLFFTPNDDGYKDTWHIAGVEQLEGTIIYIFDRYGKLLKTLRHSSPGWNGFYNGYLMPTSDYWYLAKIKYKGTELEKKGHFTLKH